MMARRSARYGCETTAAGRVFFSLIFKHLPRLSNGNDTIHVYYIVGNSYLYAHALPEMNFPPREVHGGDKGSYR